MRVLTEAAGTLTTKAAEIVRQLIALVMLFTGLLYQNLQMSDTGLKWVGKFFWKVPRKR
jgi:hypothetical protein